KWKFVTNRERDIGYADGRYSHGADGRNSHGVERSNARDMGRVLPCGGCCATLRRFRTRSRTVREESFQRSSEITRRERSSAVKHPATRPECCGLARGAREEGCDLSVCSAHVARRRAPTR